MMYWNGGWVWMAFMPLLWIALLVLAVWAVIRLMHAAAGGTSSRSRIWADSEPRETPEEILDRRYASGEIDADAYTEARERLIARRPRTP
ncbi:SHOCT domain-containing protein [Streptomyces sp. NPDC015139]|uniref:SHOCT domain-containing protein n=1 Tax=Streptomyces sp. NPDC015139 TaxID=3364942 RepID=UPI0036FA3379